MGFRPLHDWVLIKRSKPEEKTSSGIIIPDAARSKSTKGIVEAIGPGKFEQKKGKKEKKFIPTVLKPGQHVIFIDYMTKEIVLNGEEITLIQEDNILGVFESVGAVAVKDPYYIEVKKEHPPMVQAVENMTGSKEKVKIKTEKKKGPIAKVKLAATFRKSAKTGKAAKQVKAEVKTNAKKSAAQTKESNMKKTAKKAVAKKAAPKKAAAKKSVAKKVVAKKAAPKKAAKKTAPKKAGAKKTAPKKAAAKKPVKKTATKKR